MEKAVKEFLKSDSMEFERVFPNGSDRHIGKQFYDDFSMRGIRVDRFKTGFISCTFKVPPRLTDRNGNMASGAIINIVDEVGGVVAAQYDGQPMSVSVDMSVSFVSTAKVDDELEITGKLLGQKGSYSGTIVLLCNKSTGEIIAEGRHSLFSKQTSRL